MGVGRYFSIRNYNHDDCWGAEMSESEIQCNGNYWILWGGLVVKVRITEIDNWARIDNSNGYLHYEVDEPIGHQLNCLEIYRTKEDAARSYSDHNGTYDLPKRRESAIKFIVSTHKHQEEKKIIDHKKYLSSLYPNKVHKVDWFHIEELIN